MQRGCDMMPYDEDDDYNAITAIKAGIVTLMKRGDDFPPKDDVWIDMICHNDRRYKIERLQDKQFEDSAQLSDEGIYIASMYKWHGRIRNRHNEFISEVVSFIQWHLIANVSLYHISDNPINDTKTNDDEQ
jgi:hypothetical protein